MTDKHSVILLEFNELTPSLTERFMAEGKLPNFKRLYSESEIFVSDANEDPPQLNPWIQWVTVHCGLSYDEHGIFHLGDGHKLDKKCVWDLLSDAGLRVWVCGSMNVRYDTPLNGEVLPDPWTTKAVPYPDTFGSYFRFVQKNVLEHSNEKVPLKPKDYADFLWFMLRRGLSASTVATIVSRLLGERISRQRWKRATILDLIQFDLFRWNYKKLKPSFSTFFLNSTAHFQHMYWRNMEPERFKIKPTAEEQERYKAAILFGYQEMDKLIGKFLKMAGPDATIIFSTALSQQPCLVYEDQGGKSFYRPRDFEALLAFSGVKSRHTVSPVMSEQFHILFENEADAQSAEKLLRAVQVDGITALSVERRGTGVFSGCCVFEQLKRDAALSITDSDRRTSFFEVFYQVEGKKSGMHHPDGMLWIRRRNNGKHVVHEGRVPLTAIAPTVLSLFGIAAPSYMKANPLELSAKSAAPAAIANVAGGAQDVNEVRERASRAVS